MEVPIEYEPSPPSRDNECPVVISVCGVTRQVGIVYSQMSCHGWVYECETACRVVSSAAITNQSYKLSGT